MCRQPQVPWKHCVELADMDLLHLAVCQKGSTEAVFPQEAETGQTPTETVGQLLRPIVQWCSMSAASFFIYIFILFLFLLYVCVCFYYILFGILSFSYFALLVSTDLKSKSFTISLYMCIVTVKVYSILFNSDW